MQTPPTTSAGTPPRPGFRLARLEVRNWGTFHEKVHVLDPEGETALLIGENGSGKSTLVDALLTLLVPKVKRNYNLSAGSGARKRERDEKSYVMGAYGSESGVEETRAKTKFLREKAASPTILLAVFRNEVLGEAVTIGQVLWIHDDEVKKLHLLARSQKSIAVDFKALGESRSWKKTLRARGFEVEDTFADYAEKVVQSLGMESVTTLHLFAQTVAIKEIGQVSRFIRDHMLEKLDASKLVTDIDRHYQDLKACWDAIRTAKDQLERLRPVVERATQMRHQDEVVRSAQALRDALPAAFAARVVPLLEQDVAAASSSWSSLNEDIAALERLITQLTSQEAELRQAIRNDDVGLRMTQVREALGLTRTAEQQRRATGELYHKLGIQAGVPGEVATAADFEARRTWADTERGTQAELVKLAASDRASAEHKVTELLREHEQVRMEIESLEKRVDLIPGPDRARRAVISQGTGADPAELPFAGELMDVRPEFQTEWKGAIERLLRPLGLSILVPERLYPRVNRFINDNNLRGRVVYYSVPSHLPVPQRSHDAGRVAERLMFKVGQQLAVWLEAQVRTQYNFRCVETVDELERLSGFAITREGLIKHGGGRHVKDDGASIRDARNHILGWSNAEKIRDLKSDLEAIAREGLEQKDLMRDAEKRRDAAIDRMRKCSEIAGFRSFGEIDWRSAAAERAQLEGELAELESSSDKVKALEEQLSQVEDERKRRAVERSLKERRLGVCEDGIKRASDSLSAAREARDKLDPDVLSWASVRLVDLLRDRTLLSANAGRLQTEVDLEVGQGLTAAQHLREEHAKHAIRAMTAFLGNYKDLQTDLQDGEEYIDDFLRYEENLRRDDLPRHEAKFHELMSGDVIAHLVQFQITLEDHCDKIEAKVRSLNHTLRDITYSDRTYISILASNTSDVDVRSFRSKLKTCLEHNLNLDDSTRPVVFTRVSELIDIFRSKPDWTAKVTDTRNWLSFAVQEVDRESGRQVNLYEDSSGKSGGQKAKLAFTILASAVAYQYGIAADRAAARSFRFVVVDEMFSQSDEPNSRYALKLFEQFGLQLLIVSPFDARARVVERFVSRYHLTLNPTTAASTVRTVSTEEVLQGIGARPREAVSADA